MICRLVIAMCLVLATGGPARAEPITIALFGAAFASTLAGAVVTFLFTAVALTGASLLVDAIKPKPKSTSDTGTPPGIQFDVQMGDDAPIGFTVGTTATAGTRKYIGTWGQDGSTPNAYLSDVIQIGDLPAPGEPGLWINGQECTIEWGAAPTLQGYPVTEFRVNGRDHVWVLYRDGTQTTYDDFLFGKFGGHAERPYKATMIGRGCPYLVITTLFNRELFSGGNMSYLVEPPETPWYDIRLDDTAGGDGDHRWDDPSTWEPTSNPAVIIYNIVRGVYYGDEWVYGGQNLAAFRLPADNVMAAANECDADRELEGGGTEPQFRCGMEIRGDMEPLTVIAELLKACSGRIAEVGGIFKLLVGVPGSAVYAFTDDDILVTRGQSLTPFPTLDNTHNGIEATHPEPADMWATKDAPARYSSELEAADGNRRLVTGVHFPAVPFGVQVQQHMRTMNEEDRRFRMHSHHLPPDAYPLEPLDVLAWTSVRNSYLNKKFLVLRIVGERTSNQMVLLKEINPADYSFPPGTALPTSSGHISIVRPPAQPMVGWQAAPAIIKDADGINRRPSIQLQFDGNQDDIRAVRAQVRLAGAATVIFDGELPYGPPAAGLKFVTLNGTFLPATPYEARGILVPYSGRETSWSGWIAVVTPNVRLSSIDFEDGLKDLVTEHFGRTTDQINSVLQLISAVVAQQAGTNQNDKKIIVERLVATAGRLGASIAEVKTVAVNNETALAEYKIATTALIDEHSASIEQTSTAVAGIDAKLAAAWALKLNVDGYISGIEAINDGTTSAFVFMADIFKVVFPGLTPKDVFQIALVDGEPQAVLRANLLGDGMVTARTIRVESLFAISSHFGEATVTGKLTGGPGGKLIQDFTLGNIIGLGT